MPILWRHNAPNDSDLSSLPNPQRIDPSRSAAVLVLHGYTASPAGMRSLVSPLVDRRFSVHVPALPGHAAHPSAMEGIGWEQWLGSVQSEYNALREQYDVVCVVGQSLGALLAGLLLNGADPPDRTVMLCPPWRIADPFGRVALPFFNLLPLKEHLIRTKEGGPDVADPDSTSANTSYSWMSIGSLCEVDQIIRHYRRRLKPATKPVLLIHSRNDHTAEYWGGLAFKAALGPRAELITLEKSYHVLTEDLEKVRVAREVADFCAGALPAGGNGVEG